MDNKTENMACGIAIKEELENDFSEIFTHDQNEFVSIEKSSNKFAMCTIKVENDGLYEHEPFLE